MKTNKMNITAFLVLVLFVSIGCDDNPTNPDPESATISGTVTFSDGTFPTTVGSYVLISLQSQWPPTGAPYDYSIISESDLDQEYKYNYTFDNVAFGTYEAIAVSWANPDPTYNYTCNQSTIGAYGGSSANYFMTTDPIITSTTNFELTGINMDANISLAAPNPYSICQPDCTDPQAVPETENDCNDHGHCEWDTINGCDYKQ